MRGAMIERHTSVHPILGSQAQIACRGEAGDDLAASAENHAFGKAGGTGSIQERPDVLNADVLVPGWRDGGRVLQAGEEAGVIVLDLNVGALKLLAAGLEVAFDVYIGDDEARIAKLKGFRPMPFEKDALELTLTQ